MDLILNTNDSECDSDSKSEESDSDFSVEDANGNDADSSDDDSVSDSDDDEPLAKLVGSSIPQSSVNRKVQKKHYTWKNGTFSPPDVSFTGELPQPPDDISSPLEYFRQFVSTDMLTLLVENTNLYSVQKNGRAVDTDVKEVEKILGIFLLMGIVRMPGVRYYWENATRYPPVADVIARNRFQKLLTVFHFVDNFSITDEMKAGDRLWKLRPWLEAFRQNCLKVTPEEVNSIDEMMVPYKGRTSGIKQYMRGKPHAWGFKIWARTGVCGILHDFDVYQGNTSKCRSELGLSGDVVLKLTSTLQTGHNYKIFADNFFTSTGLIEKLLERGIHYTGTVRSGRLPGCQLKDDKTLSKQGRGSFDSSVLTEPKVVAVRWFDNRSVTLASTFVGPLPLQKVRRWDKANRSFCEIDRPAIVDEYNHSMGGVDLLDAFIAQYRFPLRSRRWYLYLFWHTVTVAVINAWLVYRRDCRLLGIPSKEIMKRRHFQSHVGSSLILVNADINHKRGRPSIDGQRAAKSARKKARKGPCPDVQLDAVSHWPEKTEKRGRCAVHYRLH